MARHVTDIIQALDAAIAGEEGHKQVNRLLMLHEQRDRSIDELTEYWKARGDSDKAIVARLPEARGRRLVSRLLQLHDLLDQTRGVDHPAIVEQRSIDKAEYWSLRSQIADDIDHHHQPA